ncbi:MAG: acyl-CoA dehydrogenase family protein [Solirubrobacterales bacterium]|nr:acyl-CoA dehydrogenase family protein [Solirubrobacterales bacterium]MBV9800131.1 acyl-CoA dehydrogenase family protein [Solirubrobacterales bacterium]
MIGLTPSEDQRDLQRLAAEFAGRELSPLARRMDAGEHGDEARAAYRAMYAKAAGIGLHALLIAPEHGGSGGTCIDNVLVQEELGAVDVGLAGSLNLCTGMPVMIAAGADEGQRTRWLGELAESRDHVLAGALNEPDVAGSELFCPLPEPSLGVRTTARRDGDGYLISGSKAAFVSNAAVAKAFMVFARTDLEAGPLEGTSVFYVPADTPGVEVGAPTELLGMRGSWHAEVIFDGARVPAGARLGPEGRGLELMGAGAAPMALGLAAGFVGVARAARDAAVAYASQRTSWGRPLREHQAVGLHLADMEIDLHAARLLVWEAALAVDRRDPAAARLVPAAKAFAVDAAIRNAERAVKVHGGYGVAREYPVEKLLRDAYTGWSCDFTGDMLRLQVSQAL